MYQRSELIRDGWSDNLTELMEQFDEERVRRAYVPFVAGIRDGRSIAEMARQFALSESQVALLLRRMKLRRFNPRTMRGDR